MRLLLALLVMSGAMIGLAFAQQPDPPQPEPILETGELMVMVIRPAYVELQQMMGKPPSDRRQWAQLYQKAARLAEFENLILFRPHERAATREWKTLAASARQATANTAQSVLAGLNSTQGEDFAAVRKNYEAIAQSCNACHRAMNREAPVIKP
jgi:cytochrome c556